MNTISLEEKVKRFPVTCYTRVVGWITPTKSWNKGKRAELKDRKTYDVK